MKTVIVELRTQNAMRLLKDLELADIIKVLDNDKKKVKTKLSKSIRGAISKERANELNGKIDQMRNEWADRNI